MQPSKKLPPNSLAKSAPFPGIAEWVREVTAETVRRRVKINSLWGPGSTEGCVLTITLKLISKPYLTKASVELVFCCKISAGIDEFLPPGQVPFAPLGGGLDKSLPPGLCNGEVGQRAARGLHQLQGGFI